MAGSAAFFDLDRTLLLGASGPWITQALRDHEVLDPSPIPGERAAFAFFNLFGETLPSILLTKQGAKAAKGWSVQAVAKAASAVGPTLVEQVEPYALHAIAEHRAAGRQVVLATTTPYDLVRPFADLMGFDDVLATRYRIDPDGERYDGTIDGEFVWSTGKARSVSVWATANSIELADSYAYSDSIFDVPMLSSVGFPVAVNPDPRLLIYASAKGWPKRWFNAPPGVPKPVGIEPQEIIARLARPELLPWVDIRIEGLDNLAGHPDGHGLLLAANHRSYLDPLVVAYTAAQVSRPVRFLAKKEVTDARLTGVLAKSLGAIRVDRGSGSELPMIEAATALGAGELVAVFPQGTIPRGEDFFDPTLKGRYGAARLALETETPIIPVGIWGSEKAWPRSASMPYVLNLADRPTVTVSIGHPYMPSSANLDTATDELMTTIASLLPPEARQPYRPTAKELALTYPPGTN